MLIINTDSPRDLYKSGRRRLNLNLTDKSSGINEYINNVYLDVQIPIKNLGYILIGGVWNKITSAYTIISGTWKTISEMDIVISETWKKGD